MKTKAILFDFDDTLGNRRYYAYKLYSQLIHQVIPDEPMIVQESIIQECIMWDQRGMYSKDFLLANLKEKYAINLNIPNFTEWWDNHLGYLAEPIEGVKPVLEELKKRYQIGVITNGPRDGQINKLKHSGLYDLFDVVVISGEVGYSKPDPRIFEIALKRLGLEKEEVIFVGDQFDKDILGAYNAGITPIWITDAGTASDFPIKRITHIRELLNDY